MKKLLILAAFAVGIYFPAAPAHAQMMLQKAVIASGGTTASSSATTQMGSTEGQPVVGTASNGQMIANFGFWTPSAAPSSVLGTGPAMSLGLTAFPNPAADLSKISVTLGSASNLDVLLFDVTGKEVRNVYSGPASGAMTLTLDVSGLPAGSYILAARIPGQLVEQKISVIR